MTRDYDTTTYDGTVTVDDSFTVKQATFEHVREREEIFSVTSDAPIRGWFNDYVTVTFRTSPEIDTLIALGGLDRITYDFRPSDLTPFFYGARPAEGDEAHITGTAQLVPREAELVPRAGWRTYRWNRSLDEHCFTVKLIGPTIRAWQVRNTPTVKDSPS